MTTELDSLIPHRHPMRFVDELTGCTATTATATACFGPGHWAVADGVVLDAALIECVAQTAAAALGRRAKTSGGSGGPASGMLVAVTNFRIQSKAEVEKILRIEVCERKRLGPMLLVSGVIFCEDREIASGELSLYA